MAEVTVTIDEATIERLIEQEVKSATRRIVRERMQQWRTHNLVHSAARQEIRELAGRELRDAMRQELEAWLNAREGWVARMLRRSRLVGGVDGQV
jgi:hypothetical protein